MSYKCFGGDGLELHQGHEDQKEHVHPKSKMALTKDKILYIYIKHGWREGTMFTFPKDRDAKPDDIPADIVIPLKQEPRACLL